jgi:hypothetical protein
MNPAVSEAAVVLSRTPGIVRGLFEGLPESRLRANEGDGTFCPRDVLGHLIHED